MYIYKYWFLYKQAIAKLTTRERAMVLAAAILALFGMWFLLMYGPQIKNLTKIKSQTQDFKSQTTVFSQKRLMMETLATSASTEELLMRYEALQAEKEAIEDQFSRHQQRFIGTGELSIMLHDMLKNTQNVQIDDFESLNQTPLKAPMAQSSNGADDNMAPIVANHYVLVLRGGYLDIMKYLNQLEHLHWQLYWDTFHYKVLHYPIGVATVHFYTLKPTFEGSM